MKATPLLKSREVLSDTAFVERVVWQLPMPLKGSTHMLKYRLACVVNGQCVVRYDNEAGKGDHRHIGNIETAYLFSGFQQLLADFWNGIIHMGALSEAQRAPFDMLFGLDVNDTSPTSVLANAMTSFWSSAVSPYQSNPFDINPLHQFLENQIDFEALSRLDSLKVFVVATRVSTGKAEVFSGKRLTADAVMASACLPLAFRAVEIEGDHFWDGGYSGNPAMHPLIYNCQSRDILLVQITPIRRNKLPTNSAQIMDRITEVTFNVGLIAEMRGIDFVNRLLADGKLDPAHYKYVLMHRIDGGEVLEAFAASSKISTNASMIHSLRDLGRANARFWLSQHFNDLGVRCSIDIRRDYLSDLRVPV